MSAYSFISPQRLKRTRYTSRLLTPEAATFAADEPPETTTPASMTGPMHDPPLEPHDEALFLLNVLAEVEHALLVQYLYAGYSVRVADSVPNAQHFQNVMLQIAREEMGHLMTVQNLLHLLGGPLNFHREQSPFASSLYPFRFRLQPLTLNSLAKYVIAESPLAPPANMPAADLQLLCDEVEDRAKADNHGVDVQHVGPFFARLIYLFQQHDDGLKDEDFVLDSVPQQGRYQDWGYDPTGDIRLPGAEPLIIETLDGATPAEMRQQALDALRRIAEQGEGYDSEADDDESHFDRFFNLYKDLRSASSNGTVSITWPIPQNPNTSQAPDEDQKPGMAQMVDMVIESYSTSGRITDPRARAWAQLFNLRYRMLLGYLSHFLRVSGPLYLTDDANRGDRTSRGLLVIWTFYEMRRLRKIAQKLVQLPKDPAGDMHAGPPFELPYTLNLPENDQARWRTHLDVLRASVRCAQRVQQQEDPADEFIEDLIRLDSADERLLVALAQGDPLPADALPANYQKVATILEEAVRGFSIGSHLNFWDGKQFEEFAAGAPGAPNIRPKTDGGYDPDRSALVQRIEGTIGNQMPRYRPPIPDERITFIREWITAGCPHDGNPGIQRERNPANEPAPPVVMSAHDALSFAADIKELFRLTPDRQAMLIFGIDLHKYEDVRDHADRILARVKDGTMPCDSPWPPERIAKFQTWIDDGKLP